MRLDYNFLSTSYMGVSQDKAQIIINGEVEMTDISLASISSDSFNRIAFGTTENDASSGKAYIDALGFSFDEDYEVGDNYNTYRECYYSNLNFEGDIIGSQPIGSAR